MITVEWSMNEGQVLFRRRSVTIALLLCISVIMTVACGSAAAADSQTQSAWHGEWAKTLSAAKKESKVVVFGPAGEIVRTAVTQSFRKAFPEITLEYVGGRAAEQTTRIRAERDGGVYSVDVFIGGVVTMMDLSSVGALERIEPALLLPEVRDPKYWRDGRHEFTNPETRYTLVFTSQPNPPIIYDPRQVSAGEIDELDKRLDPKWKGKIVLNDPLPAGASSSLFRWLWRSLGPDRATDYMRRIRAQAGAVDRDQRRQIEWVAQGKYAWLLAPNSSMLYQLAKRGLKFGILPEFKDIGTHVATGSGVIAHLNRAPRPHAAVVFINWLLGRDGQTTWSHALDLQTRRVDVPMEHIPPYLQVKPGVKYWISYYEKDAVRSAQEEAVIKELFGR
ncbi:MAG TPA: extracellular solute-binding protein [Candidatus Limnocylindria bacterium]|nr:extracellular solute-binding protein [Candidatus Limnocylindria bacterium]